MSGFKFLKQATCLLTATCGWQHVRHAPERVFFQCCSVSLLLKNIKP